VRLCKKRNGGKLVKSLGTLSIVCAQRDDLCLTIYQGKVTIHIGCGPAKERITVDWCNDEAINKLIFELNHGKYRQQCSLPAKAYLSPVYVCYEENCLDLVREVGVLNEMTIFSTKESRNKWINERLKQAKENDFFIDEEIDGYGVLTKLINYDDSVFITLFRGRQDDWNNTYDIVAQKIDIQI
jgi:hypothetical protein